MRGVANNTQAMYCKPQLLDEEMASCRRSQAQGQGEGTEERVSERVAAELRTGGRRKCLISSLYPDDFCELGECLPSQGEEVSRE